jgi:hypothetical protein
MGGLGVAGYYGYRWYINYRTATDIKVNYQKNLTNSFPKKSHEL